MKIQFDTAKLAYGYILKIGAIYSSSAAVIADILKPVGNFSIYITYFVIIITVSSLIFYLLSAKSEKIRTTNIYLSEKTNGKWFANVFCTLIAASIIFVSSSFLSKDSKNGFLAENYRFIQVIQEDIGIISKNIEKIEQHTANIEKNTDMIKDDVHDISIKADNFKKETSTHPRKELANRGISWTVYNFSQAIELNDLDTVKLFLSGGMDPNSATPFDNKLSALGVISARGLNTKMLQLLVEYGFDINRKLVFMSFQAFPNTQLWASLKGILQNYIMNSVYKVSFSDIVGIVYTSIDKNILKQLRQFSPDYSTAIQFHKEYIAYAKCACGKGSKNDINFSVLNSTEVSPYCPEGTDISIKQAQQSLKLLMAE